MQKWEFPCFKVIGATRPKEGSPMSSILPRVRHSVKDNLLKQLRRIRDGRTRIRYLIIINLLNGRGAYQTADVLRVHNTTVYQVAKRFRENGDWGLWDANAISPCCTRLSARGHRSMAGAGRPGPEKCW